MLFMRRLRCCIFFSRISYKQKQSDVNQGWLSGYLPFLFYHLRPSSVSLSSPWSTRSSSSLPPSISLSSCCFSKTRPSNYWHRSFIWIISICLISPMPFFFILFLIDFSLTCPPLPAPSFAWIGLSSFDPPHFFIWPALPAQPCVLFLKSSSKLSSLPFSVTQFDLPAVSHRQLPSFYFIEFPWGHR